MSSEFEIKTEKQFGITIFSTYTSDRIPLDKKEDIPVTSEKFRRILIDHIEEYANTLPDSKIKNCIIDKKNVFSTLTGCYVVKRTIQNMDYYHSILYNNFGYSDKNPSYIFISIIVSSPKGNIYPDNCNVVKGSINFFSSDVGTFNPNNCNNSCYGLFSNQGGPTHPDYSNNLPIINKEKKYITWTPNKKNSINCNKNYNQCYMIAADEANKFSESDICHKSNSDQHTHEEHLEHLEHLEHIKESNNLPLILGLAVGIGIPILVVIIILIIKRPK